MSNNPSSIRDCPAPDPDPTTPKFTVPANACDTHAHIFPAADTHRYSPSRGYTPPVASLDAFLKLHETLGISRGVLTQPSVYATDNTAIVNAVATMPERFRAVAALGSDASDEELLRLNESGVKGVRVNLVDKGGMPFAGLDDVIRFASRIADFGWHLELLLHAQDFPTLRQDFAALPVDMVIGHLGYMTTSYGLDNPGFQEMLAAAREGRCWVKLTGSYRITTCKSTPYPDVIPFARALIDAAPERMLWGSDWPHPTFYGAMPNDGYLLDQLVDWTDNDAALIKQILVDNPASLYGFDA